MANREERERLRQERLAAQAGEGRADRRRLIAGYFVAGLLAAAVIGGLVAVIAKSGEEEDGAGGGELPENAQIATEVGVFEGYEPDGREGTPPPEIQFGDLEDSAKRAGCEARLGLEEEGNTHFTDENQGDYKTNPPTSGDHYGVGTEAGVGAVADGAYLSTPPESRLVHSMEHSRVEIRYRPDLPEQQQLALKGVFDEDPGGVLMFPDPDLPFAAAVGAWQGYVGCKQYDPVFLDVVRNFRDTYRGNGPEDVPLL